MRAPVSGLAVFKVTEASPKARSSGPDSTSTTCIGHVPLSGFGTSRLGDEIILSFHVAPGAPATSDEESIITISAAAANQT
jgi:hypothetical protein